MLTGAGRLALASLPALWRSSLPPPPVCPRCLADQQTRRVAAEERRANPGSTFTPGLAPALPYRVCVGLLDEGVPLISNLVGDTAGAALGARLEAMFERATDEIDLPRFRLSSNATTLHDATFVGAIEMPWTLTKRMEHDCLA
jgi:hypothetical protein